MAIRHPIRKTEWYLNHAFLMVGYHAAMRGQFMYDRWYLFDADRVPNYRRASVYMGHCRFGIHKYTAEALIKIRVRQSNYYPVTNGFCTVTPSRETQLRSTRCGARSAPAWLCATPFLSTPTTPAACQIKDIIRPDGSHKVSQLVSN